MADYHVGCGVFGIYAGVLNKKGDKWLHKSDVTDECISASAQFLLENDQCLTFKYKGKKYIMGIEEQKESDNGWIPTAERLPTEDGLYRVTIHPDYLTPDMYPIDDVYWIEGKWQYIDIAEYKYRSPAFELHEYDAEIIAWKPLEDPYVEKGDE